MGAALLLAAVAALLFPEPLLQAAGNFLAIEDALLPADAVVAVSGDGTGERTRAAADLLGRGFAHWLILSGSTGGHARGGATAAMLQHALQAAVPADRILIDDRSGSTLDNARNTSRVMQEHGLRRAILVTSPYHTRRAAWVFRAVFRPQGLEVQVLAVRDSFFRPERWWTRGRDRDLVAREYAKLVAFLIGIR